MNLSNIIGPKILNSVPKGINHPTNSEATGYMFSLDDTIYMVFENLSDGYRSSATQAFSCQTDLYNIDNSIEYLNEQVFCFHREKANKEHSSGEEDDVLDIRNFNTGQLIFEIGTCNIDDYYPSFICNYFPQNLSGNLK